MRINEKQFSKAIQFLGNDVARKVLFSLYEDNALTYSDLMKIILNYKGWKSNSGRCAYYIRKLLVSGLTKRERGYYYLTRFGLSITRLAYEVQKECMEYDLSDCDADGKIRVMVKRK